MIKIIIATLLVMTLTTVAAAAVFAHESEEEGDYRFVVGFLHEPAYEGEKNAVSIRVTKVVPEEAAEEKEEDHSQGHSTSVDTNKSDATDSGGHEEKTAPVEGLQDTLQVEVTHVPSEVSRTMALRTVFGEPGHYVADLIPTSPGHYRFRFFGTIEGSPLDKAFDSMAGGGGFDDVQAASVIHFPETVASAREVEGAVRGVQATAQQAQEDAMSATSNVSGASTLGIIGIIVGAIGIALGGGAMFVSLRRGK